MKAMAKSIPSCVVSVADKSELRELLNILHENGLTWSNGLPLTDERMMAVSIANISIFKDGDVCYCSIPTSISYSLDEFKELISESK